MIKAYFNGCKGIQNPLDKNGKVIKVGDKLSWDYGDERKKSDIKDWMLKPIFKVENHKSGKGLCAKGIDENLYLHDFRFKYCEIILPEI